MASGYRSVLFSRSAATSSPFKRWSPTDEESVSEDVASSAVQTSPTSSDVITSSRTISSTSRWLRTSSSATVGLNAKAIRVNFPSMSRRVCAVVKSRNAAGERVPAMAPWPSFGTTANTSTSCVTRTRWLSSVMKAPNSNESPSLTSRASAVAALMAMPGVERAVFERAMSANR